MNADVDDMIRHYYACQLITAAKTQHQQTLAPTTMPNQNWELITIDLRTFTIRWIHLRNHTLPVQVPYCNCPKINIYKYHLALKVFLVFEYPSSNSNLYQLFKKSGNPIPHLISVLNLVPSLSLGIRLIRTGHLVMVKLKDSIEHSRKTSHMYYLTKRPEIRNRAFSASPLYRPALRYWNSTSRRHIPGPLRK